MPRWVETVNIGSNTEISIGDTVALIKELMGSQIAVETDDARSCGHRQRSGTIVVR